MFSLVFLGCCVLSLVIFLRVVKRKGEMAYASTDADCTAGERLVSWRLANPRVRVSKSPAGTALVLECIKTHRHFLRMHPFLNAEAPLIEHYYSLLDVPKERRRDKK